MMQQHYRMTLQDAIQQYNDGCITGIGLVNLFFQIELKHGWKKRYTPQDIYTKLGISKATFYRAIAKLQTLGYITFEVHGEITITNTNGNQAESLNVDKPVSDLRQPVSDLRQKSQTCDNQSQTCDNQTPKPAPELTSSNSPDYIHISSQSFIQSLSQGERENFLKFCQEKASQMPKPPILLTKWIEANAEDLKAQWLNSCNSIDDKSHQLENSIFGDWQNHPRFNELWENACRLGATSYGIQNIKDKTIQAFCRFIYENEAVKKEMIKCYNKTNSN